MSFDKATGTLWCGDVGQDTWEEVNVITAGGNYGWSEREGPERFAPRTGEEPAGMIDPIHAYRHSDGISVTGGFVYRGKRFPALQGSYLFGDWGMGKVWALPWNPTTKTAGAAQLLITTTPESPRFNPTVIAADAQGEPLMFTRRGIYTLARPQLLADAEESSEASEVSEMPGETGSDNHSS